MKHPANTHTHDRPGPGPGRREPMTTTIDSERTRASGRTGRIRRTMTPPLMTAAAALLLLACCCPSTLSQQPQQHDTVDPFQHLDGRQEALMRRRLASWGVDESEYRETLASRVEEASRMTESEVLRRMMRETPAKAAKAAEAGRRADAPDADGGEEQPGPTIPPTVSIEGRIVGGRDAPRGAFPQLCALYSGSSFMCGGTLIASNICLSAAHCSFVCDNARVNIYDKSDRGGSVEEFQIVDKVDCPKYGQGEVGNSCDMVVMKLSGRSSVTPMPLNAIPAVPGDNDEVVTMGWGATSEGGRTSDSLQMVEVYAMDNDECKTYYGSSRITSDMLCAGVDSGGKDACQGDSGGPLVVTDGSSTTLIGVVSWGKGCARAGSPGVYARVSHELTWIRETACKLGAEELCGAANDPVPPAPAPPVPQPQPVPPKPSRPDLPGSGGGGGGTGWDPVRPQPPSSGGTGSGGGADIGRPPTTPQQQNNPPAPASSPQNIWWADVPSSSGGSGGSGGAGVSAVTSSNPPPSVPTPPAIQPQTPPTPAGINVNVTPQTSPQGVGITCKDPNSGITMYEPSGSCASGWEPVTHSITSKPEDVPPAGNQGGDDLADNQLPSVSQVVATPPGITLGTDANPVNFNECEKAWNTLKDDSNWQCGDMAFRGGMGNKRDCDWVAEDCALRCIDTRFRFCCPATAGLCPEISDGSCANVSGGSRVEEGQRGIDAGGGIADRGIDAAGGGDRASMATKASAGSRGKGADNKFSVAGTGDRIGDAAAASRSSGEDDDGYYDPEDDGDGEGRRERRRGTRRLLR